MNGLWPALDVLHYRSPVYVRATLPTRVYKFMCGAPVRREGGGGGDPGSVDETRPKMSRGVFSRMRRAGATAAAN